MTAGSIDVTYRSLVALVYPEELENPSPADPGTRLEWAFALLDRAFEFLGMTSAKRIDLERSAFPVRVHIPGISAPPEHDTNVQLKKLPSEIKDGVDICVWCVERVGRAWAENRLPLVPIVAGTQITGVSAAHLLLKSGVGGESARQEVESTLRSVVASPEVRAGLRPAFQEIRTLYKLEFRSGAIVASPKEPEAEAGPNSRHLPEVIEHGPQHAEVRFHGEAKNFDGAPGRVFLEVAMRAGHRVAFEDLLRQRWEASARPVESARSAFAEGVMRKDAAGIEALRRAASRLKSRKGPLLPRSALGFWESDGTGATWRGQKPRSPK